MWIARFPFRFSQILRDIGEAPQRISEFPDVFRQIPIVIAQNQERISRILEVILSQPTGQSVLFRTLPLPLGSLSDLTVRRHLDLGGLVVLL
jgi:hypothetical protein